MNEDAAAHFRRAYVPLTSAVVRCRTSFRSGACRRCSDLHYAVLSPGGRRRRIAFYRWHVTARAPASDLDQAALQTAHRHLISTGELAELLGRDPAGSPPVVVVDATVLRVAGFDGHTSYVTGHEQYLVDGHIPKAVFADLLEEFSDATVALPFTRPDAEHFARAASAMGIARDSVVVIYDGATSQWAARLWWLFRSFGHIDVRVLDGGLHKWTSEGRQLEVGHVAPVASEPYPAVEADGFWADKQRVLRALSGDEPATLVCGLSPREFAGEAGHRPRLGHIPGSLNAPAGRLVDRETNAFLPAASLQAALADVLATPAPIIAYCAGGVLAAAVALALALLGRTDVAVYDGSLNEWSADENAPLTTAA